MQEAEEDGFVAEVARARVSTYTHIYNSKLMVSLLGTYDTKAQKYREMGQITTKTWESPR